jgi:hypothetical protein
MYFGRRFGWSGLYSGRRYVSGGRDYRRSLGDGSLFLGLFFGRRLVLVRFMELVERGRVSIGARAMAAVSLETQTQFLRHVLVDRAGVGFLLRDAQFRQ